MTDAEKSSETEVTEEQLMEAYAGGDTSAFRELFHRLAPVLSRVVRMHASSEEESRDVLQQTFLQLHRSRHDYRKGAPLRPWLFTIAYNLCRDRGRTIGRHREVPLESAPSIAADGTPAEVVEKARRFERLHRALASLPDDQRRVIELHWFAALPLSDVANGLGVSLSAVKVRAHRAYKRLRETLAADGDL